ncbi:MAG TPA: hypothetical protein P5528_13950, partial [Steroidobacteraceae bacterium]|nr:hypothetical protein [Steroidobacteraceae bacterium]
MAVQLVASVDRQLSVAVSPCRTTLLLAVRSTVGIWPGVGVGVGVGVGNGGVGVGVGVGVGAGGCDTKTVAALVAEPPGPLHASDRVLLDVSGPTCWLPEVALLPLQPPEAVQDVAPVELQVTVVEPPEVTVAGL